VVGFLRNTSHDDSVDLLAAMRQLAVQVVLPPDAAPALVAIFVRTNPFLKQRVVVRDWWDQDLVLEQRVPWRIERYNEQARFDPNIDFAARKDRFADVAAIRGDVQAHRAAAVAVHNRHS
jgi:hypothetical protein